MNCIQQKCVALVFGRNSTPNETVVLGPNVLEIVNGDFHVGIPFGKRPDFVKEAVGKAKRKFNSLLGLGELTGGLQQLIASKLYWTFSISKLLYGSPLINYTQAEAKRMEICRKGKRRKELDENIKKYRETQRER